MDEINRAITTEDNDKIMEFCDRKECKLSLKLREKHDKKLKSLLPKPDNVEQNKKNKWVLNLSKKELSDKERQGLEKGLNFAITPRKVPVAEIIAGVEEGIGKLPIEQKRAIRDDVSHILYIAPSYFMANQCLFILLRDVNLF